MAWGLGLAAIVLGTAGAWLASNDLPDGYQNEFIHLFTLGEIWFRARDDGWAEAWPFLWDEYYPPLLHGPAALAMAVFGPGRIIAVLAQGLWLVPLLLATGALARTALPGPVGFWGGLGAMTLLASAPAVFGNVRRYEPNIAVAGAVALALWWLARTGLSHRRDAVIFGLLCAAGLLVDRIVFVVYLAGPVAWLLWRDKRWSRWGVAAAVTAAGAGYYYVGFLALHAGEITSQLGGEITSRGDLSGGLSVFTLKGLLYYPLSWVDGGLGLLPALAVFAGGALWVWRARHRVDPTARGVLEAALVVGFAAFTILGKKQPYYAIPLIAPAAICAALGWATLVQGTRARAAGVAVLALVGGNQLIFLSTGAGLVPLPGRWAALAGASPLEAGFLGHEYVMAGPPFAQGLELPRAVDLCPDSRVILLFSEGQAAYEGQVMPTARLLANTRRVTGLLMEPEAFLEGASESRCFIYVSRDASRAWPTRRSVGAVLDQWGYEPPSDSMMAEIERIHTRAELVGAWSTQVDEAVHVYALGAPQGSAPD